MGDDLREILEQLAAKYTSLTFVFPTRYVSYTTVLFNSLPIATINHEDNTFRDNRFIYPTEHFDERIKSLDKRIETLNSYLNNPMLAAKNIKETFALLFMSQKSQIKHIKKEIDDAEFKKFYLSLHRENYKKALDNNEIQEFINEIKDILRKKSS